MTVAQFPSHLSAPATRDFSARLACNNLTFSRSLPTYFQFTREISMFNPTPSPAPDLFVYLSLFSLSVSPLKLILGAIQTCDIPVRGAKATSLSTRKKSIGIMSFAKMHIWQKFAAPLFSICLSLNYFPNPSFCKNLTLMFFGSEEFFSGAFFRGRKENSGFAAEKATLFERVRVRILASHRRP